MKEDNLKPRVEVIFREAKDYRVVAATGAWGGPTPQGEILCSFFVEHFMHPEQITVEIDRATGHPLEATERAARPRQSVRELQTAILMRPDIARSVGEWLIRQAEKVMVPKTEPSDSRTVH